MMFAPVSRAPSTKRARWTVFAVRLAHSPPAHTPPPKPPVKQCARLMSREEFRFLVPSSELWCWRSFVLLAMFCSTPNGTAAASGCGSADDDSNHPAAGLRTSAVTPHPRARSDRPSSAWHTSTAEP